MHAHNLILEAWHGLGLPGVVLACAVVLAFVRGVCALLLARAAVGRHMRSPWEPCAWLSQFWRSLPWIPDLQWGHPFLLVFLAVLAMVEVDDNDWPADGLVRLGQLLVRFRLT